jgi:hypothetical protein
MKKVVTLLAGNLEADKSRGFSRGNGLLAFTANDGFFEFHNFLSLIYSHEARSAEPRRLRASGTIGPYFRYRK